ncbi:hypothetical protein BGZ95_006171 [Linnemannia exigua]|uniref:Uncharacterized protein n=1 Tax=Linnemannia exigua TaxID=604196 RepID=A0AAD4DGL9_9FUNG|nr:hypothetical protein BGZ95_006171 [Linnemannia exigua]
MHSLDEIRNHLDRLENNKDKKDKEVEKDMEDKEDKADKEIKFIPATYFEKWHVVQGSIRKDGFHVQLLGFKLRELQDVRYHRLGKDLLPLKSTSTLGGTDYYL